MANIYEELSKAFESKLRKLISQYKSLKDENSLLKTEIERKQSDLMMAHHEILTLRKNYENLRVVQALGHSEDERKQTKQRLNKMVQEIDKCLALLDE